MSAAFTTFNWASCLDRAKSHVGLQIFDQLKPMEEGHGLREELKYSGARGFFDLNPTADRTRQRRLATYYAELQARALEKKDLSKWWQSVYCTDLLKLYFPDDRSVKCLQKHVYGLVHNLASLMPLPKKSSLSLSSNNVTHSAAFANATACFAQATQVLETMGTWTRLFTGYALLTEQPCTIDFGLLVTVAQQYSNIPDATPALRKTAQDLVQYLSMHTLDVSNTLIGLRVSDSLATTVSFSANASHVCKQAEQSTPWPAGPSTSPSGASVSLAPSGSKTGFFKKSSAGRRRSGEGAEAKSSPLQPDESYSVSMVQIMQWADMSSDAAIAKAVRECAERARWSMSLASLKPGYIVLVDFRREGGEQGFVRFGRLVKIIDAKSCIVYFDPLETRQWVVPIQLVAALPDAVLLQLRKLAPATRSNSLPWASLMPIWVSLLDRSVTGESISHDGIVSQYMDSMTESLFASYKLDFFKTLDEAVPALANLHKVKHAIKVLEEQKLSDVKAAELRSLLETNADHVLDMTDFYDFFIPGRKRFVTSLYQAPSDAKTLLEKTVSALLAGLKSFQQDIQPLVDHLTSGARKRELVSWWLSEIREAVNSLLKARGYLENVTSDDYINDAPLDFAGVQSNVRVLRALLDETSRKERQSDVMKMIRSLKASIYAKINAYIKDSLFVLADMFKVESCELEMCRKFFVTRQSSLSENQKRIISQMMDDIAYLTQMQEMEEDTLRKSMHVVPVSGLIVGRIVRLEQEMRTVCDVWGHRVQRQPSLMNLTHTSTDDMSSEDPDSSIHVVLSDDVDLNACKHLVSQLKRSVTPRDIRYKMVEYEAVFVGSEVVDMLVRESSESRLYWTSRLSELLNCGFIESCVKGMPFVDGYEFYRWASTSPEPRGPGTAKRG